VAYSAFHYLATSELTDYVHTLSSVTDAALAAKFIGDAERMIDAYVGTWERFYWPLGATLASTLASGATSGTLTDALPYPARGGLFLTLLSGTPARRLIVSADGASFVLASGFDVAVGTAAAQLQVEQASVFPRACDVDEYGDPILPEWLKVAVAWQVEYALHAGGESFGLGAPAMTTNRGGLQSRSYAGGYAETYNPADQTGMALLVAPKVRALLRRHLKATGTLRG
jgi:hypothetical protein